MLTTGPKHEANDCPLHAMASDPQCRDMLDQRDLEWSVLARAEFRPVRTGMTGTPVPAHTPGPGTLQLPFKTDSLVPVSFGL